MFYTFTNCRAKITDHQYFISCISMDLKIAQIGDMKINLYNGKMAI